MPRPRAEVEPSRYVVGIDLGTTNSAITYFDTKASDRQPTTFLVDQVTAPGETEARATLPSFHYEPAAGELGEAASGLIGLPWGAPWSEGEPPWAVGAFARESGARVPGRLVVSAKSWLSHAGVDRTADLLPFHGAADVRKVSPVAVSARYLGHLRAAWGHRFPEHPLADQDVVVTVPASFDEIARELTVEAARSAGLPRIVLLEEPQAAFYAWIASQGDQWHQAVKAGDRILICDVGGGTTDLSLIEMRQGSGEGDGEALSAHRVAVGDHLILGGDNMDLALAHHVEERLGPGREGAESLGPQAWSVLVRQCQRAKELLLGEDPPESTTLSLPGSGSKVVGQALQVEVTRAEVVELLVDGFLPRVGPDEAPKARVGFQEFGLPYAPDPGITRYAARFLADAGRRDSEAASGPVRPDFLLLNGGVFESAALTGRILEVVSGWFEADAGWKLRQLRNDRLDLAVARGAAYFGLVRRGEGVRISGGLARSYYVGVASDGPEASAVCLIPSGMEEGESVELDRDFELAIRQPAEFPIFVSSLRTTDDPGELVPLTGEDLRALPPIRTVLRSGKKTTADRVRVRLRSRLTEVGTLEIGCRELEGQRTWRLQFDARAATRTDVAEHGGAGETAGFLEEASVERVRQLARETFGQEDRGPAARPESLVKRMEGELSLPRASWPPTLLREIWAVLLESSGGRRRSEAHEARWLNLLGWSLRPGYGLALDDWRVAETWRFRMAHQVEHARNELCRAEWWILWRRIAGGLTAGQQRALAEPLLSVLRGWLKPPKSKGRKDRSGRPKGNVAGVPFLGGRHETAEAWRLVGALEWLDPETKVELGTMILGAVKEQGPDLWNRAGLWALGRLGARVPQYGPLNTLVPTEVAEAWLGTLLELEPGKARAKGPSTIDFAVVQMARLTRDRYRDVGPEPRARALAWLEGRGARAHYRELVETGGTLDADEQKVAFGESLPAGIRLV